MRVANGDDRLVVEVEDDGVGGAQAGTGSGLAGLADRVGAVDGELVVTSPPGEGTLVRAVLPIQPAWASSRTIRAPATSDCSFPDADSRGRYFMPQSGAATSSAAPLVRQRAPDPLGNRLGRLDCVVVEVEHAEDDRLAGQLLEYGGVEVRLRGLSIEIWSQSTAPSSPRASSPTAARG